MLWRTVENSTRFYSVGNFIDLSNKIFHETIVSIFKEKAKLHAKAANNFSKPVGHNVRKKWNSVGHLRKPVGHKLL